MLLHQLPSGYGGARSGQLKYPVGKHQFRCESLLSFYNISWSRRGLRGCSSRQDASLIVLELELVLNLLPLPSRQAPNISSATKLALWSVAGANTRGGAGIQDQ